MLRCLRFGCRRCTGRRSTEVPVLWSRYRALVPHVVQSRCRTDGTGAFVQLVRPPCRPVMSLDAPTSATLPLNSANNVTQYRPISTNLNNRTLLTMILSSIKGERSANPIFLIPINIDYFWACVITMIGFWNWKYSTGWLDEKQTKRRPQKPLFWSFPFYIKWCQII